MELSGVWDKDGVGRCRDKDGVGRLGAHLAGVGSYCLLLPCTHGVGAGS